MSIDSHVSLIDLSQQLPFEIDEKLKKDICFAETLIISCGHHEDYYDDESSDSEFTCSETTDSHISVPFRESNIIEIKDHVEEVVPEEEKEDEINDFQFFFFPDCKKPLPPQNSDASILIEDGMPKLNLAATKVLNICTCKVDKKGKCPCHTKLPCSCGAKSKDECTCAQLQEICICDPQKPNPTCKCVGDNVCVCDPNVTMRPICSCALVKKPCICDPKKFPNPVCQCEHEPVFLKEDNSLNVISGENKLFVKEDNSINVISGENKLIVQMGEEETEAETKSSVGASKEPCVCQKTDPVIPCLCLKGKPCICEEFPCICGVQRSCICEPSDFDMVIEGDGVVPCEDDENKSICICEVPKTCTCKAENKTECVCFSTQNKVCTCVNPENCKCHTVCDCTDPCICDTAPPKPEECFCLLKAEVPVCTCRDNQNEDMKLKRTRAGKHGYRWCRTVDPRHNYFEFAYDKHDKIAYKEIESEKVNIQGLHEEVVSEGECPVHKQSVPRYEKKVRKPCIDCCSSVGGISICVETLGEDKDKFLIQVVSYASKEGAKTGSKLVSIVDCNLHTMEENRLEHITKKDLTKERRSYMAICENGYYNKVTRICGERNVVKRIYHNFEKAHNFLLEGANIVFMRYLALNRYKGEVKTDTVLMNGIICESVYVCPGVSQAVVNGTPLFVVKIERHIIEPSGYDHQTLTTLTLRGYIVSHEWSDNKYVLHINPLLRVIPEKDEIEQHAPLRERWREDLQLLSDYLDFKSSRTSEGGRYVVENGDLTGAVRDYLQAILLLRPQEALHFTRHYFGGVLSALDLPHDEYFDPCSKHVRYYFFED